MSDPITSSGKLTRAQKESALAFETVLTNLEANYDVGLTADVSRSSPFNAEINFPELWADVQAVEDLFRNIPPTEQTKQDELWGRFNRFRDTAHEAQRERNHGR